MEAIIEGLTWTKLGYFYGVAMLGMVMSILIEQVKHAPAIQAAGGFKWATWILENWKRVLLNLLAMLVGIMFTEELSGTALTAWSAFLAGYATDDIVDALVNRKK